MITLIGWQKSHSNVIASLLNDDRMHEYENFPTPYTTKHAEQWLDRIIDSGDNYHSFAIVVNDAIVGQISLTTDENNPSSAFIGYWVGADHWGNGYATEALKQLIDIAKQLGYCEVYGGCSKENLGSDRVMSNAGLALSNETYTINFKGENRILYKHSIQLT